MTQPLPVDQDEREEPVPNFRDEDFELGLTHEVVVRGPLRRISIIEKGGPGSGHHGHEGREGEVGGSEPGPGGPSAKPAAGARKRPPSLRKQEEEEPAEAEQGEPVEAEEVDIEDLPELKAPHESLAEGVVSEGSEQFEWNDDYQTTGQISAEDRSAFMATLPYDTRDMTFEQRMDLAKIFLDVPRDEFRKMQAEFNDMMGNWTKTAKERNDPVARHMADRNMGLSNVLNAVGGYVSRLDFAQKMFDDPNVPDLRAEGMVRTAESEFPREILSVGSWGEDAQKAFNDAGRDPDNEFAVDIDKAIEGYFFGERSLAVRVVGALRRIFNQEVRRGGPGSGHHGHKGRKGEVGGSEPGRGGRKTTGEGFRETIGGKSPLSKKERARIKKNVFDPDFRRLPDVRDEDIENTIDQLSKFTLDELRDMQDEMRERIEAGEDIEHFQMLDRILAAAVDKREFGDEPFPEDEDEPEDKPEDKPEPRAVTQPPPAAEPPEGGGEVMRQIGDEPELVPFESDEQFQEVMGVAEATSEAAREVEGPIGDMVLGIAVEQGGQMQGLENAVKEADSLARKIRMDMIEKGVTADEAAADINDQIRYTMQFEEEEFVDRVLATQAALEEQGFVQYDTKYKNFFRSGDAYDGYNTVMWNPETGRRFELQFHTPDTLAVKKQSHQIYNEFRTLGPESQPRRLQLWHQMASLWEEDAEYMKPPNWWLLPGVMP